MTQRSLSLMDVLVPPGNEWLTELARRKTDLPPGVHIVRFGDGDDELADDAPGHTPAGQRDRAAA